MRTMTSSTEPAQTPYTSRWAERDARRRASAELAAEAAHARAARNKKSLIERVEKAKTVLAGKNAAGAIQTIQTVSPADYDIYLLAERHGLARKGVLKQFGAPRGSVERQYLAEVGLGSPDESPETVGQEE
jgi:hypothetical protein